MKKRRTTRIIGITGYAQHGKNSVATVLQDERGAVQVAFADKLRELAAGINPLVDWASADGELSPVYYNDIVRREGYEGAKRNAEVRRFLQRLGTEGIRDTFGPATWVDALDRRIRDLDIDLAVITDVRFENEVSFVLDFGELWGVQRVNDDFTPYDNGLSKDHPSEAYIATAMQAASKLLVARSLDDLRDLTLAAFWAGP